jgi:hypothetical protein
MSKAKSDYYAGAVRFSRDGIPCKMASWVKDLSPISKNDLLRGGEASGMSMSNRQAAASARYPETTYYDTDGNPALPFYAIAAE